MVEPFEDYVSRTIHLIWFILFHFDIALWWGPYNEAIAMVNKTTMVCFHRLIEATAALACHEGFIHICIDECTRNRFPVQIRQNDKMQSSQLTVVWRDFCVCVCVCVCSVPMRMPNWQFDQHPVLCCPLALPPSTRWSEPGELIAPKSNRKPVKQ